MRANEKMLSVALRFFVVVSIVAWGAGVVFAQDAPADPAAGEKDEIDRLLKMLTPEETEALLKRAAEAQLQVERRQAIAEIRGELLYEDDAKLKAEAIINNNPANTQQDNIDRICRALAVADEQFAEVYEMFKAGKPDESLVAVGKILDPKQATYLSAATHYIYAESLIATKKLYDGVETYRDIMVNMPDRISFAAISGCKAASIYEEMGRGLYAMKMYAYCLANYELTLDPDQAKKMRIRLEELVKIYTNPLESIAERMGDVEKLLSQIDSGKTTQEKEKGIVAILEDLIKTAEENAQQSQSQSQGKGKKKGEGEKGEGEGEGQQPGMGKGKGKAAGVPKNPTGGATVSQIVPGEVERPHNLSNIRKDDDGGGVWGTLQPREKARLLKIYRKNMSERTSQQNRDYSRRLARGE